MTEKTAERPADEATGTSAGDGAIRRRWHHRVRHRVRKHRTLDFTWRVTVFMVGSSIVAGGLVMFLTPGPGWAAVFVGLAVLSSEFAWASRLLDSTRRRAARARARALDPATRRRTYGVALIAVLVLAAGGWWYVHNYGVPAVITAPLDWF